MKGVVFALIAALLVAFIVFGIVYFLHIILGLAFILGLAIIVGLVLLTIVVFVITFVAFLYYFIAKKPKIEPGDYRLEDVKDKEK